MRRRRHHHHHCQFMTTTKTTTTSSCLFSTFSSTFSSSSVLFDKISTITSSSSSCQQQQQQQEQRRQRKHWFSTAPVAIQQQEEDDDEDNKTAIAQQQQKQQKQQLRGSETFLTGTTSLYAEEMYERYQQDPNSIEDSWRTYFETVIDDDHHDHDDDALPTTTTRTTTTSLNLDRPTVAVNPFTNKHHLEQAAAATPPSDSLGVSHLIRAYQVNGHLAANLDPLNIYTRDSFPYRPCNNLQDISTMENGQFYPPELTLEYHGFTNADLDRKLHFLGQSTGGNKGYLEELAQMSKQGVHVTLRMILAQLRKTYCTSGLGVEYMHIGNVDQMNWIRQRVEEHPKWFQYDKETKQHIFERLCFADIFETFLANKFNTTKRFGLDGGEAVVPALKAAIDCASELGVHSFVMGMPHRGRLNVLANVMRKPMPLIFAEFQGTHVCILIIYIYSSLSIYTYIVGLVWLFDSLFFWFWFYLFLLFLFHSTNSKSFPKWTVKGITGVWQVMSSIIWVPPWIVHILMAVVFILVWLLIHPIWNVSIQSL